MRIVGGGRRQLPEELFGSIAAGNRSDLDSVQHAASGLLFGLLLLILNDTTSAEEVLLEVYDEIRLQAARLEKSREDLLTGLITITHRRALEHLCSSSGDRQFAVSVGLARSSRNGDRRRFGINKSAHRRLIAATLDDLSSAERKMLELAYFSRMSPLEIALKLRQSPEDVKAGLQHGISQLYQLFKNQRTFVGASDGGDEGEGTETSTAERLVRVSP